MESWLHLTRDRQIMEIRFTGVQNVRRLSERVEAVACGR